MLRIRSRVINFRVTADEFERVKTAAAQHAATCLSDFARRALLDAAARPEALEQFGNSHAHQAEKLLSLESRLASLESDLRRLQNATA